MNQNVRETVATEESPSLDHRINGRYRLCRRLGAGGMGTVFLVEDTHRDDCPLALKCVRSDRANDSALPGLQREFLALALLSHPGVARVYDFGVDEESDDFFFTTEYVEGVDLLTGTRSLRFDQPYGLRNFLDIVVQLLRSLAYIHSQGLLHSDLKPQNVLVNSSGSDPNSADAHFTTKLIDFGLTAEEKQFTGRKIIGTRSYIAPEAVIGSHLDRRADLYSLGAVLYHLAADTAPFDGSSSLQVLKDHLEKPPVPPSARNPAVPRRLDGIILRLLAKKPSERYQNALDVVEAINARFKTEFPLESNATRLSYVRGCRPVGREIALLDLYRSFVSRARLGSQPADHGPQLNYLSWLTRLERESLTDLTTERPPRLVVLHGEKGSGKRTVLKHFKHLVQTRGARFVWVDCTSTREDGFSDPGAGFRQLLDGLESYAWSDEETQELIARLRGEEDDRTTPLAVLVDRLLHLSQVRPIVIHFHGIGRAGHDVCAFLSALLEYANEEIVVASRLLLTASRLNLLETASVNALRILESERFRESISVMRLERLDRDSMERMLEGMFPGSTFPPVFARRVLEESDGNPGATREICEFLLSEERLQRSASSWQVVGNLDHVDIPIRLRDELRERIKALPRTSFSLGVAFAILGRAANASLAAQLARISEEEARDALRQLKRDGILERISSSGDGDDLSATFSFVHSSAQQILYDIVALEKRRQFHDLAGAFCLQYDREEGGENVKRLAYQFLNARNRENGIHYGMLAARIYVGELKLRKALQTYDEVEALCDDRDAHTLDSIRLNRARIHFDLGEFQEAARVLSSLLNDRGEELDPHERIAAYLWLARTNGRLGLFVMAQSWLQKAKGDQRNASKPQRENVAEVSAVETLAVSAELLLLQGRYRECTEACEEALPQLDTTSDAAVKCRCRLFLADNAFALDQRDRALAHCREALRLIEGEGEDDLSDLACFIEAKMHKYSGRFADALHFFRICAARRRDNDLMDSWVDVLLEMAGIHLFLERPQKALPLLQEAVKACRKTKNTMSTVKTQNLLAETYRLLGQFEDADSLLKETEHLQSRIGSAQRARWESLLVQGKIALDQGMLVEAAKRLNAARDSLPEDPRSKLKAYGLFALLELRAGRFHTALNYCSAGLAESKSIRNPILSARFLELRVILFHRLGQYKAAFRVLTVLHDVAEEFRLPVRTGRAGLLEGLVAYGEGSVERALRQFESAERIFREEESEADLAGLYVERGWIELLRGEFEECFLLLEEAQYLSKKLNLNYFKPRIYKTLAVFEMKSPGGEAAKAESYFRHAERLAREGGYVDLLWQIRFYLGAFLLKVRPEEGKKTLRKALKGRARVLESVPEKYRRGFLAASPGGDEGENGSRER